MLMPIEELYAIYLQHPSVQTDTRRLKKDDLFFALKGPNFNGNQFARHAIESGASFAVIDEPEYAIKGRTVLVENVLSVLQALAHHHRQQFSIPFIGITGSNGKTTTKELAHAVLSTTYQTYTTEGNLNNHIGVPLTLLKIKKNAQLALVEMGANHLGEIASYCRVAAPSHGLITNCGKAHLEGFGGEEGVKKGKGELFDYLREKGGTAFIMQDYDYLQQMSEGIKARISYGTKDGDIVGSAVRTDPFLEVAFSKGLEGQVRTQLVGGYNLPNVLAAAALGKHFGVTEENIRQALARYAPSNSRSQLVERGTNKIILDAYNANPSSMKVAIENFASAKGTNKVLVLGAMAELGKDSLQEHEAIVHEIRKYNWKEVLLIGGDFLKIKHPFHSFTSAAEAGQWLQAQNLTDSFLLVKGSRSTQMENALTYL